ncbi:DUF296 domain-containing protein [Aureimonas sp. SA4125]|uniref:DUF296 domain-containing protein n=1 Tax=Aureimonas sp. SA4125 TaxID=2826993 RepID=UPI001CC61534|nr:DUF296 domain-containing protein [Aureimonas sp. SA4125]BDA86494.1 DUF296 domain-containing protein [Aureimonas sp. SA4125]
MRPIVHPGPPAQPRVEAVATALVPLDGYLLPGETVMAGVARTFAAAGCRGGVLQLEGGACDPFRYVLPALSSDPRHAAWYSDTLAPEHGATILQATAMVGRRDGGPFLHCHGLWAVGAEAPRMGHMLPFDSVVSVPIRVSGYGSATAWFEGAPDAETNFTLFSPKGASGSEGARNLFLRVRPNEDIGAAVAAACERQGIGAGQILGIGSIHEPAFDDGRHVPCPATEILIERGEVTDLAGGLVAELDVAVVDVAGAITRGRLQLGENPVGVTFELLIVGATDTGRS